MQTTATAQTRHASATPRVVISVVSHGQGDLVRGLLTDICEHWNPQGLHLVLTQNLREDIPPEMARLAFPTQVTRNLYPNSFAANHNAAFEVFDSDIFCVVNPDVRCLEDPMPALLEALAQSDVGLAAPIARTPQGEMEVSARRQITPWRIFLRVSGLARKPDYKIDANPIYPDWVAGMFMALHSEDFARLGGFDERYRLYCEDADLCMRLWAAGRRVALVPAAVVVHNARRESHQKLRYLRWHIASLLRYFVRYPFYRRAPRRIQRMRETLQAVPAANPLALGRQGEPNQRRNETARMRIAFIAISYAAQRDGVSIYAENLLFELLRLASERGLDQEIDVFACGQAADALKSQLRHRIEESARRRLRIIATSQGGFQAKYLQVPRLVRANGPYDAILVPNLQPLWLPRDRSISVLHDLTYRVAPTHFSRWRVHYMDLLTRFWLWRGAAIGCISRTSKADLERYYPSSRDKQQLYLPNGLPEKLTASPRPSPEVTQEKFQTQRIELLFVGRINRLKGFDRVRRVCERLDAYALSRSVSIIVHVVGKDTRESASLLAGFTLRHVQLKRHGYLDDAALNILYQRSAFCLFLSRNEGFGLPLLESIWQRCVPLLSDIAIFREVMGEGYPLFADDERDLNALVAFIDRLRREALYRREIFACMDNALTNWAGGYRQAASNLLEWIHRNADKADHR